MPTGKAGASKRGEGGPRLRGLFLVARDKLKTSLPAIHSEEASSFLHRGSAVLEGDRILEGWASRSSQGGGARKNGKREARTLRRLAAREWGQSAAQVTGKKENSK